MQHRKWQNDQHRKDFESGVRMGVGCFNLMISLLPARIMKLLEWIGFGGNKVSSIYSGVQKRIIIPVLCTKDEKSVDP